MMWGGAHRTRNSPRRCVESYGERRDPPGALRGYHRFSRLELFFFLWLSGCRTNVYSKYVVGIPLSYFISRCYEAAGVERVRRKQSLLIPELVFRSACQKALLYGAGMKAEKNTKFRAPDLIKFFFRFTYAVKVI